MAIKKSYWLKAGFFSFSERISLLLFGFGSLFLLLRTLSKADFGLWVLFLAITSIIEVARAGLLQNALVKFLANSTEEEYPKITCASLLLNIGFTAISIMLILLLAEPVIMAWKSPALQPLFQLYCLSSIFWIPLHQFNFMQQANLDFKGIFWAGFTRQGLFFGFIFFFFVTSLELSLWRLAAFQIPCTGAGALVSYFFAKKYLRFSRTVDWRWAGRLFHFGKYVFGANLSAMLYKSVDKMMLGMLLSPVAVAVYELAVRISNLAEVPTFSMASIVYPQSARIDKDRGREEISRLYESSVGAILVFVLPCMVIVWLFPEWIVTFVAGRKYLDAAPILQLTMLYGLFIPFAVQFGAILDAVGRPKVNFYFTLAGAALNGICNFVFISRFGLPGAAYGTLAAFILTFAGMQMLLYSSFNIRAYRAFIYAWHFYRRGLELSRKLLWINQETGKQIGL